MAGKGAPKIEAAEDKKPRVEAARKLQTLLLWTLRYAKRGPASSQKEYPAMKAAADSEGCC